MWLVVMILKKMNEVIMFWYCWEKMKQSTIFKLTFQTVMLFLWIFFELLYCYDISLENFFQSIFYTFFRGAPGAPATESPPRVQTRNLRSFVAFPFFPSCGSRWVNVAQHKPQNAQAI